MRFEQICLIICAGGMAVAIGAMFTLLFYLLLRW